MNNLIKTQWKIYFSILCIFLISLSCSDKKSGKSRMDAKVDSLLSLMTIEEKIGQLNLPSAGDFVTGQAQNSDIGKKVEKGLVGGLLNVKSIKKIKEMQKLAI